MKACFMLLAGLGMGVNAATINFDRDPSSAAPPGWLVTLTGKGESKWAVERDDTAPSKPNVLKQSGEATFPVCIKEDTSIKDGFVEVKFKPVSGKVDQAGGVIWRCKDANNYYLARANALEDNVEIYYTQAGKRRSFMEVKRKVACGAWHTLRVEFKGNSFVVSFDGETVIRATDNTFADAGKVGVWTKADSVTLFDDFAFGGE
jgi:hypothetical protein